MPGLVQLSSLFLDRELLLAEANMRIDGLVQGRFRKTEVDREHGGASRSVDE